jgi:hypothetical protein
MADVTIDEKELAALRLAAKFLADHGEDLLYYTQYWEEILQIQAPNATPAARLHARAEHDKLNSALTHTLDTLADADLGA